ncbi:hypothetical protein P691DRAFT_804414 [Macrolepiota fuliginosa MF-IS2]|uniref:Uncharacterized protein n=1 Tax=Macrolepiota fuliginosa MF-IS2 TaxID=1400762 RepID=A0A9P5XA98_9AGAR|nr:hypothetical protein P691DRAFT_804414 [Macrolepiota fuliginosa MF-IS2]
MPLLSGIFGKKNKSSARGNGAPGGPKSIAASDLDSTISSPTTSYVATDKSLPSSPNGKGLHPDAAYDSPSTVYPSIARGAQSASTTKLRLPFSRKKSKVPLSDSTTSFSTSPSGNAISPPRPSYMERLSTSAASDSDTSDLRRLRPPPSKSAIFAAYADPSSALSTRSLPDEPTHQSWSSMHVPTDPAPPPKEKRPSLFAWTKSSGSTKPPPQPKVSMSLDSPPRPTETDSSFNLKSFRHVRPPSPNASNSSLIVPPARPRGASVNSDSSQRISVAAFREAQARRSTAGSPAPSFRSPSPSFPPPQFPQDGQRGRASPRPSPAVRSSPHLPHPEQRRHSTNIAVGYSSDSDEPTTSEEEEDSDDDDDGRHTDRDGTVTQRSTTRPVIGKRQAKSEHGHASSSYESSGIRHQHQAPSFLTTQSQNGHGQQDAKNIRQSSYVGNTLSSPIDPLPPRSQSSLGAYDGNRQRASASTSALSPSAAAKRASVIASANANLNQDPLVALKQTTRHVRDSSTYSNPSQLIKSPTSTSNNTHSDSDGSDSDNAPLASLVPPRRPGSALSQASNNSARTNGTRGGGPPSLGGGPPRGMSKPLININELTSRKPIVGPYKGNEDGFTKGGLLSQPMKQPHQQQRQQSVLIESPTPMSPTSPLSASVTSKSPPGSTHFVPPTSPPKEFKAFAGLESKLAAGAGSVPSQSSQKDRERRLSAERKRDMLTERLARLAKGKAKDKEKDGESTDTAVSGGTRTLSPPPSSQRESSVRPDSPPQRSPPPMVSSRPILPMIPTSHSSSKPSPPDEDLVRDVDDSILRLISQMGESEESEEEKTSEESEDDVYGEPENGKEGTGHVRAPAHVHVQPRQPSPEKEERGMEKEKEKDRIAPIPIRQRAPPSSFSVTSRPPIQKIQDDDATGSNGSGPSPTSPTGTANARFTASSGRSLTVDTPTIPIPARQRSSTLIPSSTPSPSTFGTSTSSFAKLNSREGSSIASGYSGSNGSSTNVVLSPTVTSPRMSVANADRANALRTVGSTGSGLSGVSAITSSSRVASSSGNVPSMAPRQRSSTMLPNMSTSQSTPTSSREQMKVGATHAPVPMMPVKPFAVRRDSPASSTGDSSSGRGAPLTPRDGSDIADVGAGAGVGRKQKEEWSSGVSGLGARPGGGAGGGGGSAGAAGGAGRHVKRRSVSFEEDVKDISVGGRLKTKESIDSDDPEARRRERRRSEAKAAIELGNVINGPGPVVSDDEDDLPINQTTNARMSAVNPMMAMGNPMQMQQMQQMQMPFGGAPGTPPNWGGGGVPVWQQQGGPQMLSPAQYMMPPPADPNYFAAHHQAMMFAKQAYQMAVAQQAMAAAADEWDRNSAMGGSVYGGPTSSSSVIMGPSPFGMMGMGGMGASWSTGSVVFPNGPQSVYGGRGGGLSSSRSEYGGVSGAGGGNWSSARSSYGDAFGPSDRLRVPGPGRNRNSGMMRDSALYPPVPPIPQSQSGGMSSSDGGAARGRGRATSGPATPSRGGVRKAPPPSSWKAGV